MILTDSNLGYDEMKRIIINIIKKNNFSQYAHIENSVVLHLKEYEFVKKTNTYTLSSNYDEISERDSNLVREIVWDLIIERVINIGLNKSNPNWPFLSLNKSKKENLENEILLHDVDNVISSLRIKVPNIDPIILIYLSEALNTYKIGATLASCVMLGCAAEKGILLLIEAYTKWLSDKNEEKEAKKFEESVNKAIARRFEDFEKSFKAHKSDIPSEYWDDFDIVINSIFLIIRKNRNSVGHPTGNRIEKDDLSVWLHVFRTHCIKIYDLINYFTDY